MNYSMHVRMKATYFVITTYSFSETFMICILDRNWISSFKPAFGIRSWYRNSRSSYHFNASRCWFNNFTLPIHVLNFHLCSQDAAASISLIVLVRNCQQAKFACYDFIIRTSKTTINVRLSTVLFSFGGIIYWCITLTCYRSNYYTTIGRRNIFLCSFAVIILQLEIHNPQC